MQKSHHIFGGVLGRRDGVEGGGWGGIGVSGGAPKASFRALEQSYGWIQHAAGPAEGQGRRIYGLTPLPPTLKEHFFIGFFKKSTG